MMDCSQSRARLRVAAIVALSLVLSLAPSQSSQAVVPGEMNYQGLLLDDLGDPVTGTVAMVFTLFDSLVAGSPLWTETHATVDVVDGIYQVELGETTPLDAALTIGGSLFLEIEVDGGTLTPRQQLLVVPYALRAAVAEDAQQVDGLSSEFLTEAFEHFAFDGANPPNQHPSEGLGDTDGNGVPNFLDSDNDGDGLSDSDELSQGSDINLITPTLTGFDPTTSDGWASLSVEVQGTNFIPGLTVQFGSDSPTATNITATSFDVQVGPQTPGPKNVVVTLPNGESDSVPFSFFYYTPTVTGFDPVSADGWVTSSAQVQGTNFIPGLTVQFGSDSPTATNVTATTFDVQVGPQTPGSKSVVVTLPNGESSSSQPFPFLYFDPVVDSFSPGRLDVGQGTTVTIFGQNFIPGLTVLFGSQNPTPTSVTATSFDVAIAGTEPAGFVSVTVTLPNGQDVTNNVGFEVSNRHVIFVTDQSSDGDLGGIAGADATCNSLALAAGLPGTFQAWLSDSTVNPAGRSTQNGAPYVLVDGTVVANNWADLTDGTIAVNLDLDQNGVAAAPGLVWTNVTAVGANQTDTDHCTDWTSNSSGVRGERGTANNSSSVWTELGDLPCDNAQQIYCLEQ